MSEVGRVLSVEELLPSTNVVTAALAGETEVEVEDVAPFAEEGGTLEVLGTAGRQSYTYGPPDDELNILTLDDPLDDALEVGDEVRVPAAVSRYASVALDDAPDVPVLARIPHSLIGRLPPGVYDEDDLDAVAIREATPGDWRVTDVLGREFARAGFAETDWRNDRGVVLIGGDLENGVAEGIFGAGVIVPEFVAANNGPVDTSFPAGGGGALRRIGRDGVNSGAIAITTDFPATVSISAEASVLNGDDDDGWNVRFYIVAIDPVLDITSVGRQGTQWCQAGDLTAGRHRQVSRSRQYRFDASPDDPQTRNFWWGFTNDTGVSHAAQVRNMAMTLRVSYAPDIATSEEPERAPAWTPYADTAESYARMEIDDPDV